MASAAPARRVALAVLGEQRRRQAHVRDLLRTSPAVTALDERDRALASRLALGVVAASGALDALLAGHLRGRARLEPRVRDALRLSAYELCWLETPAAVAVSQGVELVRRVAPRAAGLANAVLRGVADTDAPARRAALGRVRGQEAPAVADLAAVSGYPAWLLGEVAASRGTPAARALALASLEAPPVHVATNRALHDAGEARALLERAGTLPAPTALPGSFALGAPAALAPSGLVEATDVVVADLSAQLVALACAPVPGARVLEVGQGRATKTLLLEAAAIAQGGPAEVVGVDAEPFKVRVAADRVARAGLAGHVRCRALDARRLSDADLPPELAGAFDVVLVDVPCTGVGTLRRHPEIPWHLDAASLSGAGSLPELQLAILAASAARVRPGGLLAYATCSPLRQEDEQVVDAFLASPAGRDFAVEPACARLQGALAAAGALEAARTPEGHLLCATSPGGPDAHFCAHLRRR